MTEAKKFRLLIIASVIVTALALSHALVREYLAPDLESYVRRRLHYSQVIAKKGLGLHKALYWKEKE